MKNSNNDLKKFFADKSVLVTGHTGFKGGWLSQTLIQLGARVVGYSLLPHTEPNLFNALDLGKRTKTYFEDIRNLRRLKEVMCDERIDIVLHLAAQALVRDSYDEPVYTFETNTMGSINVLEAIKSAPTVKAAVMITTDKVYDNLEWVWPYRENDRLGGHDPYSGSKACAEIAIASYVSSFFKPSDYGARHNVLVATARAGNVIGGGDWSKDRLFPDMVRAFIDKNETLELRNPGSIRPWQFVMDPVQGYLMLAKRLCEGRTEFSGAWNFAPFHENCVTVEYIVKKATKIIGRGVHMNIPERDGKREAVTLRLDASKAGIELGWQPTKNIDELIDLTFEWYRSFYDGEDMIEKTRHQIDQFWRA